MINLKNIWLALSVFTVLCFVGCKDEEPYYVSMNAQEKHLFIGDQFLFTVTQQGAGADNGLAIKWTISESEYMKIDSVTLKGMYATALKVTNDGVTVKGELPNGSYVLAQVFIQQRLAGDSDLSFALNEVYLSAGSSDSVELKLSPDFLKKFPNVSVRSGNPDLLEATLQITDTVSYVKFRTLTMDDGEAIVTVKAGDKEVNCKVNVGVHLYVSFADISLALGNPTIIPQEYFTFLISPNKPNNSLDTIKVNYLAIPDDAAHLSGINFKVTTAGDHGVIWLKGFEKKYVDNKHLLYIYVETSSNKGSAQVNVEALGNKVTAFVDVIDKNDIVVKKMKFKKEEYNTETSMDLTDQLSVTPLEAFIYWPTTWSITTNDIASISPAGFLTIHKAGTFAVTAKIREVETTCTINAQLRVLGVTLPLGEKTYALGEKQTWDPTVTANFNTIESNRISWKSSNPSVATVNDDGEITAVAEGIAQITVTVTDDFGGSYTATKEFNVTDYNIYDLNFIANAYSYYADRSGVRLALDVYQNSDDAKSYTVTLNLMSGSWDLSQNKTYTIGGELKSDGLVAFGLEGTSADITSGSISVNNRVVSFNLNASKGTKSIIIKGDVSPE